MATIDTSGIDEAFPIAGVDNDSQGFRDNFAAIKTALASAVGVSLVQTLTNKTLTEPTLTTPLISSGNLLLDDASNIVFKGTGSNTLTVTAQPTAGRIITLPDATGTVALLADAASGAIGYVTGTGLGGAVTQSTNKSTAVTLNKITGKITMSNDALANNTTASFTLTNSKIAIDDVVVVNIRSGATIGAYNVDVSEVAAGSCKISVRNVSGGSLSEAIVLNFALIKASAD